MFEALETNPTLRERVLGMTAIGAILIGGAAGVDTMLTSGWQIGGTGGAPVVYADATPQYQDDVTRDWTTAPPQRVQLAAQEEVPTFEAATFTGGLDGSTDGMVTPVSAPADPPQPIQAAPISDAPQQPTADERFDAIENDISQATAALQPESASKDDPEVSPPPSDQG